MSNKAEYDFYKSIGICVRCHKRSAEPHKIMCIECSDKESERAKESRKRNLPLVKKRDLDKYYSLKEQGICTYCKHRKAVQGKTKCEKCLAKIRARRQSNTRDIPRHERRSYGICYICGKNPVLPENGVCSKCYEIRLSAMQKCNSNRKDDFNEYWKHENNLVFGGKIL